MPVSPDLRRRLLDYQYGLLDAADAAAVERELAADPHAAAYAERLRRLIAAAATSAFPGVEFRQPASGTTKAVLAKSAAARWAWVPVSLAASVLLLVAVWAVVAAYDTVGYAMNRGPVDRELAALKHIEGEKERLAKKIADDRGTADQQLAAADAEFKRVQANWIAAEKSQAEKLSKMPFLLEVRGPATALPGAPNEYRVQVRNADGAPLAEPVTVAASVKDDRGNELYAETFTPDPANGHILKVPSGAWQKVSAGGDVFLSMTATDKVGGKSDLTENLKLLQPVYTTFLTTDKPLYRPGERVFFRSLTLDRTRFLPPDRDVQLRFEIKAPSGQVLPGSQITGLARAGALALDGKVASVMGPDGKPLRGLAAAEFALPDLPGGEYTLTAYEVPTAAGEKLTADPTKPLATRKFVVNNYTPDKLLKKLEFDGKSYGPGDVVQARLEVKQFAQPVKATLSAVVASADGKEVKVDVAPTATDDRGVADFRFTLPKGVEEIGQASLGMTVSVGGINEGFNRPVPLATRRLKVEFFPEGGDLIAGIPNRVYFRALTAAGKPADITGTLMLGAEEVKGVGTVKTLTDAEHPGANQGVGVFTFTPEADKQYSLKVSKPVGLIQPEGGEPLPRAKKEGVALVVPTGVTQPDQPIKAYVWSAGKKRTVLVGAYVRGRAVAHEKLDLQADKEGIATLDLSGTKLGGVTRITVFDLPADKDIGRDDLTPLAERLVYRAPAEELRVKWTAKRSGGVDGAFVPGEKVSLTVEARDENDKPKAAVLMAAVVNQSVITMADEKTERLLPTHFLLSGEVQKGEDLEHADFLLTKHPKAAEALDLLLGTQGWRRFAENQPAEFRKRVPAEEADRVLLVSAATEALPTGWQPALRKVFNDYYPKFESALTELERAEQRKAAVYASGNDAADLVRATADYQAKLREFARTSEEIKPFDDNWERRRKTLGGVLAGLFGLAGVSLVAGLKWFRGTPAGRTLNVTAVLLAVVGVVVGGLALVTGQGNDAWRRTAQAASQQHPEVWKELELEKLRKVTLGRDDAGAKELKEQDAAGAPKDAEMFAEGGKWADDKAKADAKKDFFPRPDRAVPPPADPGFAPPPAAAVVPVPGVAGLAGGALEGAPRGPGVPGGGGPLVAPVAPRAMGGGGGGRGFAPGKPGTGFGGGGFNGGGQGGFGGGQFGGGGFGGMPGGGPAAGGEPFADRMMMPQGDMPFAKGGRGGFGLEMDRLDAREQRLFMFMDQRNNELNQLAQGAIKGEAEVAKKQLHDRQLQQQVGLFNQFLPQAGPLVVREYAHVHQTRADPNAPRTDFTETLLWKPVIVTPDSGEATLTFDLGDDDKPYRVLVAGHTLDGRIGATSGMIEVRKPFSIDPKLPQEVGSSDVLDVPVVGLNGTAGTRTADVTVTPTGLKLAGPDTVPLTLNGTAGGRAVVRMTPDTLDGPASVTLAGKAGTDADAITRTLTVVPDGFPASGQNSDLLEQKMSAQFPLPKQVVPGTLKMRVMMYPNTLSEVQSGLEGLLREPNGCFEQTSTTNYPNVLILDYLNETNQAKPEVSKRAKELLDRGYGRLTSFECLKGDGREGYEWFGGTAPPHESLTAYGLLQFTDMSRVFPVDAEMLKRTKKYLIDSRDGSGGFKKNPRALDTFGYAPAEVANAYIVWAVTEAERMTEPKSDLTKEVESLTKLATAGEWAKDPYFVGLVANSLLNRGDRKGGEELLTKLAKAQDKDGQLSGAKASVTNSTGMALEIETTALAVLGWLKANEAGQYRANVDSACRYIGSKRSGGGDFGSTQSTILALKALIEYARNNKRPAENGTVTVTVNGAKAGEKAFTTQQSGPIVIDIADPETLFKDGKVDIQVSTDAKESYPCTVSWECRSRLPNSSAECPVKLSTSLSKAEVTEGDTVRLSVTVENLKGTQNGMVTAVVGIPAGLKVPEDMKQLKLLTDRKEEGKRPTVSYWEKRGRELVFYWHGLADQEKVEFGVDLIADVPGEYRGPASRVYLYYGAEHKHWADPVAVKITAK